MDEVGVCMDVVEVLGDVGGDLDRDSTEEVVFAAATGVVGAGGTYGFRRGRQRAERKAVIAVPVGARERRGGFLGGEAEEGMVAWSWKRAAPRNQREKHLSGWNLGDDYEQERLCPIQALSGDFFWEVDLEANDFNCLFGVIQLGNMHM